METSKDKKELDDYLEKEKISFGDALGIIKAYMSISDDISKLSDLALADYRTLLDRLIKSQQNTKKYTKAQKGEILEKIVLFLLEQTGLFKIQKNLHTSTNEIDHLISLTNKGKYLKNKGLFDIKGDVFLSECKNHQNKVDVTYVGKFFSLLLVSSCKLGIIFSYHGLTGTGWNDGVGLTKKIYLYKEKEEEKYNIIDINIKDFKAIAEGTSLLTIIEEKLLALKTDTSYEKFICNKHPAEQKLT